MSWSVWRRRAVEFLKLFDGRVYEVAPELELFAFREALKKGAAEKLSWKASILTDASWGGSSTAAFSISEEGRGVFEGAISKEGDLPPEKLGFAAVTFHQADDSYMLAEDYENLVVRGLPDRDNTFSVTLRGVAIMAPELAYQGFIRRGSDDLADMILPFDSFLQTRGGRVSAQQLVLDGGVRFNAISFAVSNDQATPGGPFRFEFDKIFAANVDLGDPGLHHHHHHRGDGGGRGEGLIR
mmetsp:Transcript_32263/g.102874  ORF Transcript_32263/g.102874 Transcript_32263/m.102874 type:complete len:240 (-) Transcript_32263:187-906(-)